MNNNYLPQKFTDSTDVSSENEETKVKKKGRKKIETMTGAESLLKGLEESGVDRIFGYPGGASIPIFDAILDSPINLVLCRHEQGGTHMADGYARATGKAGVVLVTSGPGATNTITGILTAQMDSVPLVVISGQTITSNLGLDAFQETNILGVTMPLVKHSYLVKDVSEIPRVVKEAIYLAESGRPGVILIDIPKDVSSAVFKPEKEEDLFLPGYKVPDSGDLKAIAEAAEMISMARRPLILLGRGSLISGASAVVKSWVEKIRVPVVNTLLAKGAFPENHELCLGMLGMHGTAYANKAVMNCDLIMSIGSRWDDRIVGKVSKFCKDAKIIHVDIDPAEIGKMVNPDVSIIGDAKKVIEKLCRISVPGNTEKWVKQITEWKKNFPLLYTGGKGLRAQLVIDKLYQKTKGKAYITTDVGQHQMWAAQFYKVDYPDQFFSSGGAGTMGFGFPAAIGVQFAKPDAVVIAIVGDGGFQMTSEELSTAVIHKLPLKILILDNKYLGMVRQWQHLFYDNRKSGVDMTGNPDFVILAKSYGCKAFRISKPNEVDKVLTAALAYNEGPCLIHAEVEKEDNVFPMIPSGAGYDEMVLEPPKTKLAKPEGST